MGSLVAIQSVRFPNVFLRMDGYNVTRSQGSGSGTVNCQFYDQRNGPNYPSPGNGNLEVFEIVQLGQLDTGPGIAIRSYNYPQAYLRMDGSSVTQFEGSGGGTINCQYYPSGSNPANNSSDFEHYIMQSQAILNPGYYSIASGLFPGVYLRIDGSSVSHFLGSGGGTVNCQFYPPGSGGPTSVDAYEVFNFIDL
jgi:hypothetical protein